MLLISYSLQKKSAKRLSKEEGAVSLFITTLFALYHGSSWSGTSSRHM